MRIRLTPIALALLTLTASTARAEIVPDAGQSIREIQTKPPVLPPRQTLELNLPDTPDTHPTARGPTMQVAQFRLTGNQAISSADLLPLLADLQNRTVSFGELQAAAGRITLFYRQKNYPLARAYLPAQDVENGVVTIAVLEGHFGE